MNNYHKIESIFKRDINGNFLFDQWTCPEFKYLANNKWVPSEKIDGTNIRIMWDAQNKLVAIGGHTNNSKIPVFLLNKLNTIFIKEKFIEFFPETDVCLYGEGFGLKIQKTGSSYIKNDVSFILFDIKIGHWWLTREAVTAIAKQLKIYIIPELEPMTLYEAIDYVKEGFISTCTQEATENKLIAEGLVLRPIIELKNRAGNRIITKLKHIDFKNHDNNSSKKIN